MPLRAKDTPLLRHKVIERNTVLEIQTLTLSVFCLAFCVPLGFVDGYEWDIWT